jgi:hypothetical protein
VNLLTFKFPNFQPNNNIPPPYFIPPDYMLPLDYSEKLIGRMVLKQGPCLPDLINIGLTQTRYITGGAFLGNIDIDLATLDNENLVSKLNNAPGGWISPLYSFNVKDVNCYSVNFEDETNIQLHKSLFIPTVSALGQEITENNIHNTWQSYTSRDDYSSGKIRTPFDRILGMPGDNEEHNRVSPTTKNFVLDNWIKPDLDITQRPVRRLNQSLHQTVSKPVAYVLKESVSFAGSTHSFTIKPTATVNMVAGEEIDWLPGFTAEHGSTVTATIDGSNNGNILKREETTAPPKVSSANYLKESSFRYVVYDYTQKEQAATLTQSQQPFSVYPNPATNEVYIWHNNEEQEAPVIKLYDNTGRLQLSVTPEPQATYKLSISNLAPGLYNLHIITNQTQQHIKLIKQ